MQNRIVDGYIVEKIRQASSLDELQNIITLYLDDRGFSNFTFEMLRGGQQTNQTLTLLTNYPGEWIARYINEGYFRDDLVHRQAHASIVAFQWSDIFKGEISKRAGLLFQEASEFNIRDGITIPVRGTDRTIGIFSAVPDGIKPEREEALKRHTGALIILAPLLHEQALTIIRAKKKPRKDRGELTGREKEVLKWIAIGKTAGEISGILQIAETTVNDHAARICEKLNAVSRTHAAVIGCLAGIIEPV